MLEHLSGLGAKKSQKKKDKPKGKVIKKVAKISLAPARAAFLAAVAINFLKLGTDLAKAWAKDKAKVSKFWEGFGGKVDNLKGAISKGSKKKITGDEIGNPAAAFAAALPIIIKVKQMFKDLGLGKSVKEDPESAEFAKDAQSELEKDPTIQKGAAEMPEGEDAALLKPGEQRGSVGLIGASMFLAALPLALSIIAAIYLTHYWLVTYSPGKIKNQYTKMLTGCVNFFASQFAA